MKSILVLMPRSSVVFSMCVAGLCSSTMPAHGLSFSGITEPVVDALLSSTVPGTLVEITVEQGAAVTNQQILVKLDDQLETLEVSRRKLVWESKIEVESATSRSELLLKDYEATKQLFEATKSVSREELETKELEYQLSQAELKRLEIVEKREELEYKIALQQLKQKVVRAPGDGIVTDVLLDEGENCEQRQPILRFVDISKCYFKCSMDAAEAGGLTLGQEVTLSLPSGRKTIRIAGKISYIAPVVDPASGLQEVKAQFDNPERRIRPGVAGIMELKGPS